jgi:hypothetical protein
MSRIAPRRWLTARLVMSASAMLVALATTCGLANGAVAQVQRSDKVIYTCEDDHGRIISADRPIADCSRRELRVLNNDGSLRRIIAAPLTREQQKQKDREELQRQDDLAKLRARQARDRSLLLTFEDEQSLESMRRRQLADIDHEIRLATLRILSLDKDLKIAQAEAARFQKERAGRPLPFVYQQRITDAANAILAEDSLIRDRQHERSRLNERFDTDAMRLRELLGRPTTQSTLAQERAQSRH